MTPESSRLRLLQSAKSLFASRGYENTSTMMIARQAGTSESQLVKHFGTKDGVLEAIFEAGWEQMRLAFARVQTLETPLEKLRGIIAVVVDALEHDHELKELMLLEARRVRRQGHEVLMSAGFLEFIAMVDSVLAEMHERGELRAGLHPQALRSALIGMSEGVLRDGLIARRMGATESFGREQLERIVDAVLPALVAH